MGLTGKRALLNETIGEGAPRLCSVTIVSFPSEGEGDFALVRYPNGDTVTVHKSRVRLDLK